ncbi:maternal effect protein staufen [Zeugodacus cucurbitae]|uniref:maternal effect protein staufen n=1 Tax=Zeugodacus cucurbitae TaxID=28588 RepID=UPI000596A5AE|nr:maternal effect protein staufen [Zeugodacus cucurbitae]
MQHHAHVARTAPPHLRAHHMAVPPPHTQTQPHMPPLSLAHVPPPPTGQQQQQQSSQQKQSQHLSNGPANAGTAAVSTGSSIAAASHVRDHHTARLNQQPLQQHQQHPSSMHSSTQLQKLRQQHQHINNNNNNNNSTNKNNYHHHQGSQYNNNTSNTPGNALPVQAAIQQQQQSKQSAQVPHHTSRHHQQQQHQLHHQQQPQQQQQQATQQLQHKHTVAPMPPQQSHGHVKHQQPLQHQQTQPQQTVQTANLVIAKNVINTHVPPPALTQPQHLQQQQPPPTTLNYYTAGNTQTSSNNVHKSKYNNNNNSVAAVSGGGSGVGSGIPPKTILQNPNRVLKARVHSSSAANNVEVNTVRAAEGVEETHKAAKSGGNIAGSTTETVVSEIVVNHVTAAVAESTNRHESLQNVPSTGQADASSIDANKENMISATQNSNTNNEVSSSSTVNSKNNILSNEDNTVPKNSKEKTPMCLVNELARYNKITHQYRLTNEKGPAHCKRFTVTLKLGEEEYSAEGFKIKKAQHLAAAEAIEKTKYKHPVPKVIRRGTDGEGSSSRANITPTVELNALAMKLGQQTYYLLDPRQVGPNDGMGPPPPDAMMAQRFNVPPPPPPHTLPPHAMTGGPMLPQHPPPHVRMMDPAYARRNSPYAAAPPPQPQMHGHPAGGSVMRPRYGAPAQRAYMPKYNQQQRYPLMAPPPMAGGPHNGMLPPPPLTHPQHPHHGAMQHRYGIPAPLTKVTLVVGKQKFVGLGRTLQQAKHDAAARALQVLKTQAATQLNEELNSSLDESDNKSPISLVYEIGIQRSLTVHFKVLREDGPAHMKKFVTACVVGTIVTEGEGNGKKISKKRAAEKMLEELKKLPPLTPTKSPIKRIKVKTPSKATVAADAAAAGGGKFSGGVGERRKRGSSSIREKTDADTEGENPITRLIQLQQNRKEKEPVFELIAKNGNENSRRREFIIEVTAHAMVARGTGNSKKLAKRNAAQNLLLAMSEKDQATAEVKSTSALPYAQSAVAVESPITTNAAVSKEQTNTVLQPSVEAAAAPAVVSAAAAVTADGHIDVPLVSTTAGQVPGILILRHNKKNATKKKEIVLSTTTRLPVVEEIDNKQEELPVAATPVDTQTAPAAVASNAVNTDSQVVAPASVKPAADTTVTPAVSEASTAASSVAATNSSVPKSKPAGVHTKDQLLYLAKLLGFEVNFSDFPKGNHSEFLTIVTLSSNPPQICHGMGTSAEESQNDAAQNALKLLSKLGLNNAAN